MTLKEFLQLFDEFNDGEKAKQPSKQKYDDLITFENLAGDKITMPFDRSLPVSSKSVKIFRDDLT